MRFVRFDTTHLGVLRDDAGIVDVTDRLGLSSADPLGEYVERGHDARPYAEAEPDTTLSEVRVEAPLGRPGKIVAAPLNYESHIEESLSDDDIDLDDWFSIEDFGYFLKAPSSVIGPADEIELPFEDRRVDHEIELAFIMGDSVKDADAGSIQDAIFGYTILLDITVRGEQDRSRRKSYDTFTVVGPQVVTPDDLPDPQDLDMELRVDGDTRQESNTGDMVYTAAEVVEYASLGTTIEAGDLITTGTPAGVGPIVPGDTIHASIDGLGSMTVDVTGHDRSFADHFS